MSEDRYSVHKSFGSGAFVDRDGSDIIGSPAVCKRLNDQDLEFSTLREAYRRDVDALQGEIDELEADRDLGDLARRQIGDLKSELQTWKAMKFAHQGACAEKDNRIAELEAERYELRIQLKAWHSMFGTSQLTHAIAAKDVLAKARAAQEGTE